MNRNLLYCVIAILGVAIGYIYIQKQPPESGKKIDQEWPGQSQEWIPTPPPQIKEEPKPEPKVTPPPQPKPPEKKRRDSSP